MEEAEERKFVSEGEEQAREEDEGGEEKDEGDKDEEEGGLLLYCSTVHFELCNTLL